MRLPGGQTDPAEVELAPFAYHVIAAAVFLDGSLTLRTLLNQISASILYN